MSCLNDVQLRCSGSGVFYGGVGEFLLACKAACLVHGVGVPQGWVVWECQIPFVLCGAGVGWVFLCVCMSRLVGTEVHSGGAWEWVGRGQSRAVSSCLEDVSVMAVLLSGMAVYFIGY